MTPAPMARLVPLALAALTAAGCSLLGPDGGSEVAFRLFDRSAAEGAPAFAVTFGDGRRSRTLGPGDFAAVNGVQSEAGPFETATSGTLRAACSVLGGGGEPTATAEVSLPLRPDWRYSVDCAVGPSDPSRLCFGCLGSEAAPVPAGTPGAAPGDSLFLVWGGTSISSPVLY